MLFILSIIFCFSLACIDLFNKNSEIIIKNKVEFLIKNYKTSLLPVWFALLTIPFSSIWSIILAALL